MVSAITENTLDADLKELIMQARGGDLNAYKTLLSKSAPLIRRTVSARIGRWGQQHFVDDIVQDALLAIHLKLHTYDINLSFLAWLNAIARHKLIDTLRRTKGVKVSLDDEGMPELIDPANPEAPVIAMDLQKLLARLKPPAGEIVYALKVEGASIREVANTHKLSEANVKVIVHRALQKLSEFVREG